MVVFFLIGVNGEDFFIDFLDRCIVLLDDMGGFLKGIVESIEFGLGYVGGI